MFLRFRQSVEYLAGERDLAPPLLARIPAWLLRSAVWLLAIALIYAFCGQSSKFIYIDF
ncbi:MAG TPA: hypothetical protein VGN16_25605 [Acidobacteriaceae bacterium]|jgi:hypothetical protein